jgi:hypothetical protein
LDKVHKQVAPRRGRKSHDHTIVLHLGKFETPEGQEQKSNLDLDLTKTGHELSYELLDVSCSCCGNSEDDVNVYITEDDEPTVIAREEKWDAAVVREMANFFIAISLIFIFLFVPEKNQKYFIPILLLIAVYFFGKRLIRKR